MPYNKPAHDYHPRTHRCPRRGCQVKVPDARFACPPCWAKLSPAAQAAIRITATLPVLHRDRRAAFRMADESWASSWPAIYAAGTV